MPMVPEVTVTRVEGLTHEAAARGHRLLIDEPIEDGGGNRGPTPHETLCAALGACTGITLRLYADRKGWPLATVAVKVTQRKRDGGGTLFERMVTLEGALSDEQRVRLLDIAQKCPVHKTLTGGIEIATAAG